MIGAATENKVQTVGDGRPIFFLHGWQLDMSLEIGDFEPAFDGRKGWRRIYTDLPGMGSRRDEGYDLENFTDLCEWVVSFIEEQAPDEEFAIAGMSVGGQLARGVVERLPERTLGLLLRVPRLVADRRLRSVYDPTGPDLQTMRRDERDSYLDRDDNGPDLPKPFRAENDRRHALWNIARSRANLEVLKRIEADYELRPLPTKTFERPALILVGRQDTRVGYLEALAVESGVAPVHGVALHAQYPRATIAALDRAGHALPVGPPALFHALVRDWLDRMEEDLAARRGSTPDV